MKLRVMSFDINTLKYMFTELPTRIGKKRARPDGQNFRATPTKKVKCDLAPKTTKRASIKIPRPPKVNTVTKAALKEKEKEGGFFE